MRFILTLVLIIFLLLVFTIPSALIGGASGGGGAEESYVSWTTPGGEEVQVSSGDFFAQMRTFHNALRISPFAAIPLGIFDREPNERQLARLLVLERMANEAGIVVSRRELGLHLKGSNELQGISREFYDSFVTQYGVEAVEGTLLRVLRATRFLQLAGNAGALADPNMIEELWHDQHEELAFDYMSLAIDDMKEEARKELPDDEALSAWFDEQPEVEREALMTPERRKAEYVYFVNVEETPGTALLAEYPDESERDPEEMAEEYYNRVYFSRFTRPQEDLSEGETPTAQERYLSQEETQEQAMAEAPIYFAMQAWLGDLQGRQAAGEEIDLAAEAERLGLEHTSIDFKTREELPEETFFKEDESTATLVSYTFQALAGGFGFSLVATGDRVVIVRTTEVQERVLPPFEDIRGEVAEKWIAPKAEELATGRLQEIWESLEEFTKEEDEDAFQAPEGPFRRVDADAFQAAAAAADLATGYRDFVDKGGSIDEDPDWEAAPNKFIATHKDYYALDTDEVAEPLSARDKSAVYLIRMAAKRPVSLDLMQPSEYESYKMRARSDALTAVADTLDYETLAVRYNLWLASDDFVEEVESDQAEPAENGTSE
jgi:hypothetical protein